MLSTDNLTYRIDDRAILHELRLEVRRGEVLALIGPNGAGKTTLLRTLARLLAPTTGTVVLEGRSVWELTPQTVARQLALAPQVGGTAWPLTVGQIVELGRAPHRGWLLPLTSADRAAVEAAMERTGVAPLRDRPVSALSGGEQRRVILARTLAQAPQLLLLDEPTAYLDLKYQVEILDLARRLAHQDGLSVVITLHDLNQAGQCADRLALLANGRLLAVGAPDDVLTPEYLRAAYDVPVVVTRHPVYNTPLVAPVPE